MLDADGYPRERAGRPHRRYDTATGELPASLPERLHAVEAPANLLCHSHDEKLWNLQMITVKGRLEKRTAHGCSQMTSFDAPSRLATL